MTDNSHLEDMFKESEILVIDDDHMNIEAMCTQLRQFSLNSSYAHNGRDAVKLVSNRLELSEDTVKYKLIMCDYAMTEMDGLQCMKAIRKLIFEC